MLSSCIFKSAIFSSRLLKKYLLERLRIAALTKRLKLEEKIMKRFVLILCTLIIGELKCAEYTMLGIIEEIRAKEARAASLPADLSGGKNVNFSAGKNESISACKVSSPEVGRSVHFKPLCHLGSEISRIFFAGEPAQSLAFPPRGAVYAQNNKIYFLSYVDTVHVGAVGDEYIFSYVDGRVILPYELKIGQPAVYPIPIEAPGIHIQNSGAWFIQEARLKLLEPNGTLHDMCDASDFVSEARLKLPRSTDILPDMFASDFVSAELKLEPNDTLPDASKLASSDGV